MEVYSGKDTNLLGGKRLIQCEPTEIAQQITVAQSLEFMQIIGKEYIQMWENKQDKAENIFKIGKDNDKITRWVISAILQAKNVKEQVNYYKKFSRVAKYCFDIRNYSGCAAVVYALIHPSVQCIQRLREVPFSFTFLFLFLFLF